LIQQMQNLVAGGGGHGRIGHAFAEVVERDQQPVLV
jgi:hypothetical protein